MANELSLKENIMILWGHYKGIDQRIRDYLVTREISVGDYVLTGGELPACIMTDAIVRDVYKRQVNEMLNICSISYVLKCNKNLVHKEFQS